MTIQELIDRLEAIKDKTGKVKIGCEGYMTDPDEMGINIYGTNDGILICDDCFYVLDDKEKEI